MGPDLGNIEDIESVLLSILLGHSLDKPVPAWVVTSSNLVEEIVSSPLGVLNTLLLGFLGSEVLDTLSSLVVVLDVVDITLVVNPSEGVG